MRILYLLTDGFGGHGGIALYNRDMLRALSDIPQVDAVDAVPRIVGAFDEALPPRVNWRSGAARGMAAYLASALHASRGLGRTDLIYCAHVNLMPVAALIKALRGTPVALMLYGIEAWTPLPQRLRNRAIRAADDILSISEYTLARFLEWTDHRRERAWLLPNAVHLEKFGAGSKDAELVRRFDLEGKRVLLIFGRMHPTERKKGFDELLEALPAILEREPRAVLLLAGDGDDRPRLSAKAKTLGVERAVRFTGPVAESEKAAIYRLADGYIMPSYQEGFGYVHLEAMACGIPVVASRADGAFDAVRGGLLGDLIDPHDRAAVVAAALKVLKQAKGVPAGLDFFAYPNFVRRVASWLGERSGAIRTSVPQPAEQASPAAAAPIGRRSVVAGRH